MKKVKLQLQTSIDGYIADKSDKMDWITWTPDEGFIECANDLIDASGTILMGRKLAQGFIPYWTEITKNPDDPQYSFARKMVDTPKIVFSKTADGSGWDNTKVNSGDVVAEINKLKQGEGKDIIVYGGGSFASSLIKNGLIDEYHLFVNPAILGDGLPIYKMVENNIQLKLIEARPLQNGIVLLRYGK